MKYSVCLKHSARTVHIRELPYGDIFQRYFHIGVCGVYENAVRFQIDAPKPRLFVVGGQIGRDWASG